MIYTVTLNPSLDYVTFVGNFETGKINKTKGEAVYPGGKGVNVSVMLSNLGISSVALGFCAGFTGEEFRRLLIEKGIKADLIKVKEGLTRINVKIRSTVETDVNAVGPVITEFDVENLYKKLDVLNDGDTLVMAGSVPESLSKYVYRDICEKLKDRNINIVVDTTGIALMETLVYKPFLIKPNHEELGEIFKCEIDSKETALVYAKKMQEKGARNVLVSMAGEGAVLACEDGSCFSLPAPKGILKNSVGAGDSSVAGFIAGYTKKRDYKEAFKLAVCAGSASAFSNDLASGDEVRELYKDFFLDTDVKIH